MCIHMDVSLCTHMQRPKEDIIVHRVLLHSALYFETVFLPEPRAHSWSEDSCPPRPRDPPASGCLSLHTHAGVIGLYSHCLLLRECWESKARTSCKGSFLLSHLLCPLNMPGEKSSDCPV